MQPHFQSPSFRSPGSSSSLWERVISGLAILALLVGIVGYVKEVRSRPTKEVAQIGGTLVEGIVADSPTKVDRIISSLTNIGLTYRDQDSTIKPALAQSWEIQNDYKTYVFRLHDGFSAEGLLTTIKSNKTNWEGIEVTAPTSNTLQFNLPEPLSLFLATTTKPLFPFGPYEVVKRDQKEVILRSNTSFVLGEPYLQKIILKEYESQDRLQEAVLTDEITASADFGDSVPQGFNTYTLDLPRFYILFFNVTRAPFKNAQERLRVINKTDGAPVTYNLVTNQMDVSSRLADDLVNSLKEKHMTVNVTKKSSITLQKEDIPKRQFDMLLYGVNYGIDPDYYPFWHSSQVNSPGLNISGVKDKELDKLLETARREPNPQERANRTKEIEDFLTKNNLQQVVLQEKFHYGVSDSIKGVHYANIDEGSERYNLVWRWYIKSKRVRQ